jgi:hypothetical protein
MSRVQVADQEYFDLVITNSNRMVRVSTSVLMSEGFNTNTAVGDEVTVVGTVSGGSYTLEAQGLTNHTLRKRFGIEP